MVEMAWTNIGGPAKMHRQSVLSYSKEHPTQKPVELMEWCISKVKEASTVADQFMGSGTTGVACANMGKTFYGIEREPKYFDIACKRIEQSYAQSRLFE
jgi:site-specific DNA-methyltransferase (adenine-specific)/modification methylase